MGRFIEGADRTQMTLLPEAIDDYVGEDILERVQQRLDDDPNRMSLRCQTVEHPFGTIKAWMGATHFKMKTLKHVATEMALHVLAYNLKRVMAIFGVPKLLKAI